MKEPSHIQSVITGQLLRDYIITPEGKVYIDIPGGNLLYAAVGFRIWEDNLGLISRIGENFPQLWLQEIKNIGFDIRGVKVIPETLDHRIFTVYLDNNTKVHENPVSYFAQKDIPFPVSLLGYKYQSSNERKSAITNQLSIRISDIPTDYLDATYFHLCSMDYKSQLAVLPALRQEHVSTITLDPDSRYMDPDYWDEIPNIVNGITAILTGEQKIRKLFQSRATDLWNMAEAIGEFGCEIVVIQKNNGGQLVYDHQSKNKWEIPLYPVKSCDPTGANDAFSGGFLAGFKRTFSPLEAALHGNISASMAIEGSGPFYALNSMSGLAHARLENLRNSIRKV